MQSTNDRILASAHKVAKALHEIGAMDDVTMREMNKLCSSTEEVHAAVASEVLDQIDSMTVIRHPDDTDEDYRRRCELFEALKERVKQQSD